MCGTASPDGVRERSGSKPMPTISGTASVSGLLPPSAAGACAGAAQLTQSTYNAANVCLLAKTMAKQHAYVVSAAWT